MSCATTLFIALLLIPLIFGGTLFVLNEAGQAYFETDPIVLPPRIAGAINRIAFGAPDSLLPSGQAGSTQGFLGQAGGDRDGDPGEGVALQGATPLPGEPVGLTGIGSGTPSGALTTEAPAADGTHSQATPGPSATPTPSPTGSPSASPVPTSTATPTPISSATQPPTATSSAPPGQDPPSSTPVPTTATSGSCTVTFNNGYEGTVLELINQERQDQGLTAYSTDSRLRTAALVHASDMACNDFFSHTGTDGSSPSERVSAQGYSWSSVGENIYAGSGSYGSPTSAFEGWMGSPGHRANILSTNFTQIGVGYVYFADSTYRNYYVTVFAAPR